MGVAIALVVLVVGSLLFHFLSPWYFTPIASNWSTIDDTISITFWVTGAVFVAVNLFMAYAIWRYAHRKGARAHYEPENKKLETWLLVVTTVGVAAMLAPGLFVWAKFVEVPSDAAIVEAVAPAVELDLPVPRQGRQARRLGRAPRQRRQSFRPRSGRPGRQGRRAHRRG